ncbi:MAG TPA: HAMP domain-containing sensor histidine kinase [Rhodocyclaceae bacterium]|nr:HAMP domain-containing sensor histidine kinase [Rhodocyclaceae bacterium]
MNQARPPHSLRLRLLAGTLVWITATILIAGWGLSNLFQQHVAAQFRAELNMHLDQLTAHFAVDAEGRPKLAQALSDPRLSRPYSGCYWQIDQLADTATAGKPGVLRSRSLWDHVLAVPQDTPGDGEIHQHRIAGPEGTQLGMVERTIRIDTGQGVTRSYRLIAATDESLMTVPVTRFNGMLWLALGVLGSGLLIAALVQVWVGLAPLRKLQAALAEVRSGTTQGIAGDFPQEVTPLIDEFNRVLTQNAAVVERARTQAGNLAHALKTPLSVLANAANTAPAGDPLARLVHDQISLARKQVDYHLSRAQAAAAHRLPGARTPLAPVIEGLIRAMEHIHAERGLQLQVAALAPTTCFRGEAQDLQEMLGNLLDNACKWAAHTVVVSVQTEGEHLQIDIDDDGPGIAASQRTTVLQRGIRADEAVPGSGLGLAIVDDLARLYSGQLALHEAPLGGLRATLTLPAAA